MRTLPEMLRFEPRLVIFDLDGTVVDTLPPTLRCFQEVLGPALGRVPTTSEIQARFGPPEDRIIAEWVGEDRSAGIVEKLYACYQRVFHEMGPFPGMVRLLGDLRARGIKTALFTGRGRPSTDVVLESMGLLDLFDVTVTGEEVPRPKPSPDGIEAILTALGESREVTVFVGDTLLDLEAGRRADVTCLVALWGGGKSLPPRGAEIRVESVATLRAVLLRGGAAG